MATAGFEIRPHEEAAAFIRGKPVVSSDAFYQMLPELRARVFTVSGLEGAGVMQRVRDEIATLPEGADWDGAKKNIVKILDDSHFEGGSERRAELLVRTHGFQAYQATTYKAGMEADGTTHWQYLTMEDHRVRPTHVALDGITLPKNDPFWKKHFPPWEWGCRCRARGLNKDLVQDVQAADESRAPDEKLLLEGPALDHLRSGQLQRAGQSYDVTPPTEKPGADRAFSWEPGTLKLPVHDLQQRYDPPVWHEFRTFAQSYKIHEELSIWDWLMGTSLSALPAPTNPSPQ